LEEAKAERGLTPLPLLETPAGAPLRGPELRGARGIARHEPQPVPAQHSPQSGQQLSGKLGKLSFKSFSPADFLCDLGKPLIIM